MSLRRVASELFVSLGTITACAVVGREFLVNLATRVHECVDEIAWFPFLEWSSFDPVCWIIEAAQSAELV